MAFLDSRHHVLARDRRLQNRSMLQHFVISTYQPHQPLRFKLLSVAVSGGMVLTSQYD